MFVAKNPVLDSLRNGGIVIGTQLRSRSTAIAELIGLCGFDFVRIETEHMVYNDEVIENTVRAAQLTGAVPLLRIPTHEQGRILQVLDMGIQGLILPHVDFADEEQAIIRASKYPPIGDRGASFDSRAAAYGLFSTKEEYFATANKNVMIIPMIESVNGVKNVEAILDAGADAVLIGRDDLSLSMGLPQDDPEYRKAIRWIIDCATERKIAVGTGANSADHARRLIDEGYRMITYMADLTILSDVYRKVVSELRTIINETRS